MNDEIEKELNEGLDKKVFIKRISLVLVEVSVLLIAICIFIITIGNHSRVLFNNDIYFIANIVLIISIILLISGILIFIKLYNIPFIIKRVSLIVYAFLFGIIVLNVTILLYLLYGPAVEFREFLVKYSDTFDKYSSVSSWFYSEEEIEEIRSMQKVED